jgi:hypothetical protein
VHAKVFAGAEQEQEVVNCLLNYWNGACSLSNGRGAFIKSETNGWMELSDFKAPEKVTSVMRNGLHSKCRSSTHSKMAKRRHERARKDKI